MKENCKWYKMNNILIKILLAGDRFVPESKERLKTFKETEDSRYVPKQTK